MKQKEATRRNRAASHEIRCPGAGYFAIGAFFGAFFAAFFAFFAITLSSPALRQAGLVCCSGSERQGHAAAPIDLRIRTRIASVKRIPTETKKNSDYFAFPGPE